MQLAIRIQHNHPVVRHSLAGVANERPADGPSDSIGAGYEGHGHPPLSVSTPAFGVFNKPRA